MGTTNEKQVAVKGFLIKIISRGEVRTVWIRTVLVTSSARQFLSTVWFPLEAVRKALNKSKEF